MADRPKPLRFLARLAGKAAGTAVRAAATVVAESLARSRPTVQSHAVNSKVAEPTSKAVTEGIRVTVEAEYLPEQSSPGDQRYVFAYTVSIVNEGQTPAQLRSRHWIITDGNGIVEEVKGPGVVGESPRLTPGESFTYTSGCVLKTPLGTMHGTYRMYRDDGTHFDAVIAPFTLASPVRDPNRLMN